MDSFLTRNGIPTVRGTRKELEVPSFHFKLRYMRFISFIQFTQQWEEIQTKLLNNIVPDFNDKHLLSYELFPKNQSVLRKTVTQ